MSSKQPKTTTPTDADLKGNPGIGTSKGMTRAGADPEELEGDNTVEGDVANDVTPQGGIDPNQRGRTNP
ncbi:hypothetical protein [Methylobacterium sp. WSM2598]|uniref:hypothetical protein n=1 Tax=Methylobacterium sp. WSM2598 TaxID=398261 RepID=UPI00035D5241|nr:hypothetical protein [Methylobacterium sp. WSM2598]